MNKSENTAHQNKWIYLQQCNKGIFIVVNALVTNEDFKLTQTSNLRNQKRGNPMKNKQKG